MTEIIMKNDVEIQPIPCGTDVQDIINQMEMVFAKPEYKTNKLPVHWSGFFIVPDDEQDEFIELIKSGSENLALWKDEKNRFAVAWVEPNVVAN